MHATPALASRRRALLVGIDQYVPRSPAVQSAAAKAARPKSAWSDLRGAVNDIDELREVLIARYGFNASDIHVLKNADATRVRLLSEIRAWLVDSASAGDVSFFFYSGHGSQVRNSRSEEADKLDESLVPADANRGAPDVRDKELAALFGAALDKNVLLTAMFDSCHSGSIGRGAPRAARFRFIQPDERDVADPSRPSAPEERGALIISASQDYQLAAETEDDEHHVHGLFSSALLKTLRSMPVNQTADRVFLQLRALMQSGDIPQEPVLAARESRRRSPLFGEGSENRSALTVAVQSIQADGSVILQGGIAAGIRKGAELQRVGEQQGITPRLRVIQEQGLTRSKAVAIGAATRTGAGLTPGTLFEVVRWAANRRPALRVWTGPAMDSTALRHRLAEVQTQLASANLKLIDDPTVPGSDLGLVRWNGSVWQLVRQGAEPQTSLSTFDPSNVARRMISVPLTTEAAAALDLGIGTENDAIDVVNNPDAADYQLIGRERDDKIEYAWVRPLAVTQADEPSALPVRTDWFRYDEGHPGELAEQLRQHALRLGTIRSWLQLESPADSGRFPYHLAVRNVATNAVRTTGPTKGGETYQLVLTLDEAMARDGFDRRFVYLFAIDSDGRSQLLFPRATAGAVENRLPISNPERALPEQITLREFTVSEPYGVDTFVMLTTASQLADPTVLEADAVRTRGKRDDPNDPLSRLLRQTSSRKRGLSIFTPTDWSLERLTIESTAP
jgi:hypothetical protein